jgi:class 3 adenylate cyclase/tetratricopeptide (TPR) repeat protein
MRCPSCMAENVATRRRFCVQCGAPLPVVCANCGFENEPAARFCGGCGKPLSEADIPKPASGSGPPRIDGAERRQLTVMFCDLVGSTALASRLDPEDLREVIGAYHKCVADTIARYDGFIARYMGDGVLVYFGYPQAHEHDAEQAVRAGLAIVEAVRRVPIKEILQVRIGLATGIAVVGDLIGSGLAQEQAVIGETPNLAARLQALAGNDEIVIPENTRRMVGNLFDYQCLGELEIKGLAAHILAFRVVRESQVGSRFEALRVSETRLVGREEEIELLQRRWEQIKSGAGSVVLISGEPGIGKSRLAEAFRESLEGEPFTRLRYFCSPHHQDSAVFPFIRQLERAAGFERDDTPSMKLDRLEALVAKNTPAEVDLPLLAELLSVPVGNRYPALELTPPRKKEKTFEALLRLLAGLARQQHVLMLFEDLHWADPTSRELLDLTVDQIEAMPVLLIATFRPEYRSPWTGQPHVTTLSLRRLRRGESSELVRGIIGAAGVSREVVEEIVERTDGVPLFLEELTKAILESAVTESKLLAIPATSATVPATLHASLLARLDRLGPAAKEVAQIGAAIGREFSYELLAAAAQRTDTELHDALGRLLDAGLVFRRGIPPHATFLFKHTLVRDTAYSTLLRDHRRRLHTQAGTALEKSFPEIVEAQPEVLAHHFSEGGLADKAARYWLRAGKNATARSANLEAIEHLRRGIEAVGHLPGGSPIDRLELDLQFVLGPCLIATQGPIADAALVTFERARELCERLQGPPEHLDVLYWLAVMRGVRGELREALQATAAGVDLAKARGDMPALINFLRGSALALILMGRPVEALARTEEAVEIFNASDDRIRTAARSAGQDAGAAGLAVMAWALWFLGYPDRARAQMAAALERANAIAHPHTQAYCLYYASILYVLRREFAVARLHAERCLTLSDEHAFRLWGSLARIVSGICASLLSPSAVNLEELKVELDNHGRRGHRMGITALYALLGRALLQQRLPDVLSGTVGEAQKIARETNEQLFEAELCRLKARAVLMGEPTETSFDTHTMLEHALALARGQNARSIELLLARDLAELWRDQGKRAEARDLLASIYSWFTEGLDTADLKEAKALLEELG